MLLAFSAFGYSQSTRTDIYFHNGDDHWNIIRREKQLEYERLRNANMRSSAELESMRKAIEVKKREMADFAMLVEICKNEIYDKYSQVKIYKPLTEGRHIVDVCGDMICVKGNVLVYLGKIVSIEINGKSYEALTQAYSNQKGLINIVLKDKIVYVDLYFLYN